MNDWVEIGKVFGLPALLLVGMGLFFYKKVWTFIECQVKDAQQHAAREQSEFIDALKRRDEGFDKIVTNLERLNRSICELRNDINRRKPQV